MLACTAGHQHKNHMNAAWYEFRGFSRDTVRMAREWYAAFLPGKGRLLDIGCGRGEFLDVGANTGLHVEGVDADPEMLAHVHDHKVTEADAFDFLQSTPATWDVISALHVVEHLRIEDAAALIRLVEGRLNAGGKLVLAGPNPGSLPTISHEFWRDPTHVRPYDLELLVFLCREAGLQVEESGVNPQSERGLPVELSDLDITRQPKDRAPEARPAEPPAARWLAGKLASSAYARDLEAAVHSAAMDTEHTRDELRRITGVLRRVLEVVYEPSEIYVVAYKMAP